MNRRRHTNKRKRKRFNHSARLGIYLFSIINISNANVLRRAINCCRHFTHINAEIQINANLLQINEIFIVASYCLFYSALIYKGNFHSNDNVFHMMLLLLLLFDRCVCFFSHLILYASKIELSISITIISASSACFVFEMVRHCGLAFIFAHFNFINNHIKP